MATILPESTPVRESTHTCPNCGQAALDIATRSPGRTVRVADCACPQGHIWTTKWLEVA